MAARVPPGGAGTVNPLTGLAVPDCKAKVPSLPSWSTLVHPENPLSNPPFAMSCVAWAGATAISNMHITSIETRVMEHSSFLGIHEPIERRAGSLPVSTRLRQRGGGVGSRHAAHVRLIGDERPGIVRRQRDGLAFASPERARHQLEERHLVVLAVEARGEPDGIAG